MNVIQRVRQRDESLFFRYVPLLSVLAWLPYEQRFLFGMAFSIEEVARVAVSRVAGLFTPRNKPTIRLTSERTTS